MDSWDFIIEGGTDLEEVLGRASIDHTDLRSWLRSKLDERGIERGRAIKEAQLNQTFGYQIFSGTRNASRDKLLQLAFGMSLGIVETCELLERSGASALQPHNRRDVIVAFHLERRLGLVKCNERLWELGEATFAATQRG